MTSEQQRLQASADREVHWKRWGPYLSERQWGTVREDYSANGDAWNYFPHDHARSRAYRWGEDGIAGICDRHQHICFALALWNEKDRILKERLFGLTNFEGNHGEDVKEYYYYLDAIPTNSYLKYLYKYPQAAFPYDQLRIENTEADASRSRIRTDRHGRFQREPLFRCFRRIRESHLRRHSRFESPRGIAGPSLRACIFCRRSGFAIAGTGAIRMTCPKRGRIVGPARHAGGRAR